MATFFSVLGKQAPRIGPVSTYSMQEGMECNYYNSPTYYSRRQEFNMVVRYIQSSDGLVQICVTLS